MKKTLATLALCALTGLVGCSPKAETRPKVETVETRPKVETVETCPKVEITKCPEGYEKAIYNSPWGRLHGSCRDNPSERQSKYFVSLGNNKHLVWFLWDHDGDGNVDEITARRSLEFSTRDKKTFAEEFEEANKILKYWLETE